MTNELSDLEYDFDIPELPQGPIQLPSPPPQVVVHGAQPPKAPPPMPPPAGMGMSPQVMHSMGRPHGAPMGPPPMRGPMVPLPMGDMGAVPEAEIPTGHLLGLSILLPAVGTLIGLKYDGIYGGLGGALAAGSLINVYRAAKYGLRGTDDKEAVVSATYAVVGIGASIYLFMKAYKKKHQPVLANEDEDDLRGVE